LPEGEQDAIFQAGGASPQEVVRTVTMKFYPADRAGFAAAIEKGLRDSSSPVRAAAAGRLEHIQRSDAAPLLHEHLRHQDRGVRLLVIAALARFADRASIPKLVEVFDDPDLQIRDKALQAAQSIRQTIEEREKLRTAAGAGAVKD
jgi:HEAT repeat protein